jgi:hypothetical protein
VLVRVTVGVMVVVLVGASHAPQMLNNAWMVEAEASVLIAQTYLYLSCVNILYLHPLLEVVTVWHTVPLHSLIMVSLTVTVVVYDVSSTTVYAVGRVFSQHTVSLTVK